ncbi:MAG TPA: putative lipid II flippase FtsW [Longimicrobiales bacterium]|nr:putative lipid II flippase FtsW [Longimicrobiales bacterium]
MPHEAVLAAGTEPVEAAPARATRLGIGWEGPLLLLLTVTLLSFGLVSLYSASSVMAQTLGLADYHFVVRQAAGAAVGLVLLVVAARLDYRFWRRFAWPLLAIAVLLLLVTVIPGTQAIAPVIKGARRWLVIGPVALQPSEIAKLAVLVWTAMLAVKKQDRFSSLSRGLLPFLIIWGLIVLLIFLQPNLSTALLILLLATLVVFAGGARIGHFILLALVGLPILWRQVESAQYRLRRLAAFLDPSQDPAGISYQITQSLIALGSGGLFGRGVGRGQQKFGFLPEPHNDFIFSMIGEEWGFIGVAVVVVLFTLFALVGYRVARQAPDLFGFLLAVAMTNLIAVQAFLHMGVAMALVPTTGVTLPFISYGRSSLLVCLVAVGILMSIARAGAAGQQAPSATGPGGWGERLRLGRLRRRA